MILSPDESWVLAWVEGDWRQTVRDEPAANEEHRRVWREMEPTLRELAIRVPFGAVVAPLVHPRPVEENPKPWRTRLAVVFGYVRVKEPGGEIGVIVVELPVFGQAKGWLKEDEFEVVAYYQGYDPAAARENLLASLTEEVSDEGR